MKEQRDKLIAIKKAEREKKVKDEEERKKKMMNNGDNQKDILIEKQVEGR